MNRDEHATGLFLTGGGARAAYQVGVLKAMAEWLPEGSPVPFKVIAGNSAGAINAATLASEAGDFRLAVSRLEDIWSNFKVNQVYRTDSKVALSSGVKLLASALLGGLGRHTPKSLLDNSPLRELLATQLNHDSIQHWIDEGVLNAFSVTAAGYGSGQSVTFYQGKPELKPWSRMRRMGLSRDITLDHLMASVAIPILFPAVKIGRDFYGDGSMRQSAPLSPVVHLGANRLMVIGVRNESPDNPETSGGEIEYPRMGQIAGYILDTLFMDSLSADIERLRRINQTLSLVPEESRGDSPLRQIDLCTIFPSTDIRPIAGRHMHELPGTLRYFLRGIGADRPGGRPLTSYLMFHGAFCRELLEMGYNDAQPRREDMLKIIA